MAANPRLLPALSPSREEGKNQIEVESATPLDWSLRRQLYDRIYHSLTFEQWAPQWDKPVRIIVNDGHAILAGRVLTAGERQIAGNIALGTLAFSVDNQVQVEGPRPEPSSPKLGGVVAS